MCIVRIRFDTFVPKEQVLMSRNISSLEALNGLQCGFGTRCSFGCGQVTCKSKLHTEGVLHSIIFSCLSKACFQHLLQLTKACIWLLFQSNNTNTYTSIYRYIRTFISLISSTKISYIWQYYLNVFILVKSIIKFTFKLTSIFKQYKFVDNVPLLMESDHCVCVTLYRSSYVHVMI